MTNEKNTQHPDVPPQKRVLALSTHGDEIWQMCQPMIDYFLTNGDEELQALMLKARAYWEQEQAPIIAWGNQTRLFEFAAGAIADIAAFKKAMKTLPPETTMTMDYYPDGQEEPVQVDVVIWLAMKAAERVLKQGQPTGKKIIKGRWKRKHQR